MAQKKVLKGTVVSAKANKTAIVAVSRKSPHPLYKKMFIQRKKYAVHDEDNTLKAGDEVRIIETRPYSKRKYFRLLEVLK